MPTSYPCAHDLYTQLDAIVALGAPRSSAELLELENRALAAGRMLAALLVAGALEKAMRDDELRASAKEAATEQSEQPLRGSGSRYVDVRLAGGGSVRLEAAYLNIDRRGRRGRKRKRGGRGTKGGGCYPVLMALGIHERATPWVQETCVRQLVLSHSVLGAQEELERQGLKMNIKTLTRIGYSLAGTLAGQRDSDLAQALMAQPAQQGPLAGQRVMVSVDGGRVKTRTPTRRGPKRKNGRRGFSVEWREPRGLYIAILDEEGNPVSDPAPWLDMAIRGADDFTNMLTGYLFLLGASAAKELVVIADGATWLWNRLDAMLERLGLEAGKVTRIVDFYHACEYLTEALDLCKSLKGKARGRMFKKLRRWLRAGELSRVIETLKGWARGRRASAMNKVIAYFSKRTAMLAFNQFEAKKLPLGSGAIESTIRRVLNLRFKGPGIQWRVHNVDNLLHVRALALSGRLRESVLRALGEPCADHGVPALDGAIAP